MKLSKWQMVISSFFNMVKKSEVDRPDQNSEADPDRQKGREEAPLTDDDIYKAIKNMKDRNGTTIKEIRKYLVSTFDKFKNIPVRQLETSIKKATIKGVQNGRLARREGRFVMAKEPGDAASSSSPVAQADSQTSSKRYRRRRGKCRVHRTHRPYCSRYKKRCCRRRRRCRASVHRSKKSVCSKYRSGCCRRVKRR
ncbi:hypothetical protein Btru_010748 [Bulinus truncatus]|nr:hypothetical protein Btru_010748 [Bulinus truncatus]